MKHTIKANRQWSADSVREACINNNLFTNGDCDEYDHMLTWVNRMYPDMENMCYIAETIEKYSDEQTISNIMYILEKEAVTTTFEIDGQE